MIIIILSSITILVIGVKEDLPRWLDSYDLYFVTSIFIIEYLLRMWIYSDVHKIIISDYEESLLFGHPIALKKLLKKIIMEKWHYVRQPSALIDLIAIVPSYREIRILRVLVLFRAFKILRYAKSMHGFLTILRNKKVELITLLTLTAFFIFVSGIMLYVFEGAHNNPNLHSLFDAFYWALVTISTVGYGDITPVSTEGRAISMIIMLTGIGLISFITSVIVSSFNERLHALKEERVIHDVRRQEQLTILCGFGLLGRLVAEGLEKEKIPFVIIDRDQHKIELAQTKGYQAICADATQSDVFKKLGIHHHIAHVLALTSDDTLNTFISINIKSLNQNIHVTARCSDEEIAQKLRFAKIDQVMLMEELGGKMGAMFAGEPMAFALTLSLIEQKRHTHVEEIVILSKSPLENKTIKKANFDAYKLSLIGVYRPNAANDSEFIFNPPDDFILKAEDRLVCVGYDIAIAKLKAKV